MDWTGIKYFKPTGTVDQFASPDKPGSADLMDRRLIEFLDKLREYVGQPLIITSGFRTPEYNRRIGGAKNSAHLRGKAADIACSDNGLRFKIQLFALGSGIKRIETSSKHVHVDIDETLPQEVSILV